MNNDNEKKKYRIDSKNKIAPSLIHTTPQKAIRKKCLDCCCGGRKDAFLCAVYMCPLYPYRMKHNPFTYELTRRYVEETENFSESFKRELLSGKYPLLPMDKNGYPKDIRGKAQKEGDT